MSSSDKRVCLVSMPFLPINMPALGVSTLKATLARASIEADVYYAAFDFFRFFAEDAAPEDVLLDYNFVASTMSIGDVFFSQPLWGGDGAVVQEVLSAFAAEPNPIFTREQMARMGERLRAYAARVPAFIEHCYRARDWDRYDIVGFSSTFSQNVSSLALARLLRERHPHLHIVFGGANCEGDMGVQIVRSFPQVDTVIRGEADLAFPRFVERLRRGEDVAEIPGVVYRADGDARIGAPPVPLEDMDSLPYPDFDDYFAQRPEGFEQRGVHTDFALPIETSRGCWWGAIKHCIFCGLNPTTMSYRSKSPERALGEFRHLRERYGERRFYAVDNILSKSYVKEVLPELEAEGLQIFYETKSNLTEAEVEQLARAGVNRIQPGIEGLSSEVLEIMQKGVKGYQNVELLKWSAMYGVHLLWFYLYGFPREPVAAYLRDIALMDRLWHLPPPKSPNPVLLDRYSPLFSRRDEYGLVNVRPVSASRIYYQGLTDEERANISYHFDMDLPQGRDLPYVDALWGAILRWNYEHLRGARFYQFEAESSTLLLDTRRGRLSSLLLTGAGHRVNRALRRARLRSALRDDVWPEAQRGDALTLSQRDLVLLHIAEELGAESISSPASAAELPAFLDELDQRGIVLAIDGRYIALAVDCTRPEEAPLLGLRDFVRQPGRRAAADRDAPRRRPRLPVYVGEDGGASLPER